MFVSKVLEKICLVRERDEKKNILFLGIRYRVCTVETLSVVNSSLIRQLNMSAEAYRETLDRSLQLSIQSLKDIAEEGADLNDIRRKLILDTSSLVTAKNSFRRDIEDLNSKYLQKRQLNDSNFNNTFLTKWEIQRIKNSRLYSNLMEVIREIPDLRTDLLNDVSIENFQDYFVEKKEFERIISEDIGNLHNFIIPKNVDAELSEIFEKSDINKFKLVQLHDKYYNKKISNLNDSLRKWESKLNRLKSFKDDAIKFKNEIEDVNMDEHNDQVSDVEIDDDYVDGDGDADIDGDADVASDADVDGDADGDADADIDHEHDDEMTEDYVGEQNVQKIDYSHEELMDIDDEEGKIQSPDQPYENASGFNNDEIEGIES